MLRLENARILAVDDEAQILELIEALYQREGALLYKATDGETALAMAADLKPDLILLDVVMPGVSGYDVCRRLRESESTRRIPVILVTGLGSLTDKLKGLEAGADDFLNKPVNAAELIARSRTLLRVKGLGDQLEAAYQDMGLIAAFTNSQLLSFDARTFTRSGSRQELMEFLLSAGHADRARPERALLLEACETGGWTAWHYMRQGGEVFSRPLDRPLTQEELDQLFSEGDLLIFNRQGSGSGSWRGDAFLHAMDVPPPAKNLVAFRGGEVALLGFDYGKEVGPYEGQVLSNMAVSVHLFLRTISNQVREVENAFLYTIGSLARAAEMHDEDTGNHIVRVNRYAELVATQMGCSANFIQTLAYSAQMHDVGKLHVHPDILRKPGRLSEEEFDEVKKHTIYGARVLGDHARLEMARVVAISHHEHFDGSGYPYGLAGEDIPLAGRITIIADVYDALRNPRVYKPPFSHQKTCDIILNGDSRLKPSFFDPEVLKVFANHHGAFERIYQNIHD